MADDSQAQLDYLIQCCVAIKERRYEDVLHLLKTGLSENSQNSEQIDTDQLINRLLAVVLSIESSLEKDFGLIWRKKASPTNDEELRCSFCGSKQSEVQKIIAGPGVFICDNCTRSCFEIISADDQN